MDRPRSAPRRRPAGRPMRSPTPASSTGAEASGAVRNSTTRVPSLSRFATCTTTAEPSRSRPVGLAPWRRCSPRAHRRPSADHRGGGRRCAGCQRSCHHEPYAVAPQTPQLRRLGCRAVLGRGEAGEGPGRRRMASLRPCPSREGGDQLGTSIAAAGQMGADQSHHDRGHSLWLGPIADVLARIRRLVHGGPHVAWVEAVPPEVRLLRRPGQRLVIKRRLAGPVAAPCLVVLDARIRGDVDDHGLRVQRRQQLPDQLLRSNDVGTQQLLVRLRFKITQRGSGDPPRSLALLIKRSSLPAATAAAPTVRDALDRQHRREWHAPT